jgi:hypothetical protein
VGGPSPEGSVIESSNAMDSNDDDFIYDRKRFHKYKAHRQIKYYDKRRVTVERGLEVVDFDAHAPHIREVLKAQG